MVIQEGVQAVHIGDPGILHSHQDITFRNAVIGGIALRIHIGDIQSRGKPVIILIEGGQCIAGDSQSGTSGDIALVDDLIHDVLHRGTGDGKAKTLHTGGVGKGTDLHGVDADDLTVAVDQGTAGVAGVQSGVGLDQAHGTAVNGHIPVNGRYNAVGEAAPEFTAQGIADGSDGVTHPQ